MHFFDDLARARPGQHLDPRPLARDALHDVELLVDPVDTKTGVAAARLPVRAGERLLLCPDETDLHEIPRTRLEMARHPVEMPAELDATQMKQRVDRTDGAVERRPEIEMRHVDLEHVGPRPQSSASDLHHPRRAVNPGHLAAPVRERLEHPAAAAPGLEHPRRLQPGTSQSASSEMSQSNAIS